MEALGPEDPQQVGPYRVLARLGRGGMGTVYLGRTAGGRSVAVKLIRSEFATDPEFRRRFQREVAAARRVSGRWTPPVLDADTEGRQPWVATAYLPGPDLAEALRRFGPLPVPTLRALGAGLAEGLLTVHGAGLVHRDLKPSNVLLSLDGPRLIDFGIARALDGTATAVTRAGTVIGSPGYMSPEQAGGGVAGPSSDVFSLGAVLAAAATGRPPFGEGPTGVAVMYRVVHEQPDLDGVPDALRAIIEACLSKDPARRPTAQQVRAHLLSEPDATASQAGWLPPAISEAVARVATELLHLDAPQAPVPPTPPLSSAPPAAPAWHTVPATRYGPPTFAPIPAPAPYAAGVAKRPRHRALVVTAFITIGVVAGVVGAVLANNSHSGSTGNSASSGDVPAGMLGTWQGTEPDGATLTLTLRQGRLGSTVGTVQAFNAATLHECGGAVRLTTNGPDQITFIPTNLTGNVCGGAGWWSSSKTASLESAAAISINAPGSAATPIELIKQ